MATQRDDYSSVKGCTRLDCFRNEDVRQKLNVIPITENINSYSKLRGERLQRMDG